VRRSKVLPEGGRPVDLAGFVARMKGALEVARQPGEVTRSPEAVQLWAEVYRKMSKERRGFLGAITARSEAQVLRLSLVYALLDGTKVIRPEHIRAAMAVWQYCEDSAAYIFGCSTGNALADRLFTILREGPATTTELHARTNRHYNQHEMGHALSLLVRKKLVRREVIRTGGRSATVYSAVEGA
jgi:hypothetical protein